MRHSIFNVKVKKKRINPENLPALTSMLEVERGREKTQVS